MDVRLKSQYQLTQVSPEPSSSADESDERLKLPETQDNGASIRWVQLRKLGSTLYPTSSPFGRPTTFICGSKYLAIGTFSADILLFDYDQTLVAQLSPHAHPSQRNGEMLGPVTCLAFSFDESHIVAGFGLGSVCLFDLEAPPAVKPKLISFVTPLSREEALGSTTKIQRKETHVHGLPVTHCGFLGKHRRAFISIDASGVLIMHKHHRLLLEYTTRSRKVVGSHAKPTQVLGASMFGCFVAILTPQLLEVLMIDVDGISSNFTEVLRISRVKDTEEHSLNTGSVSFFKTAAASTSPQQVKLVYTWGRHLKVIMLELNRPVAEMASASSGYTHSEPIEQLAWVQIDVVVLLAGKPTSRLDFVKLSDASVLDTERLAPSLKLIKLSVAGYSLFAMGKHEFSIGKLANWADRMLALVNNGEPSEAVRLAVRFFESSSDLSIFGLPRDVQSRRSVIKQALPDLILTAVSFSFRHDQERLKKLLPEAIRASTAVKLSILEQILDLVDNEQWSRSLYMRTLISLIEEHKIKELPPAVFKEVVAFDPNAQLFYNLDLTTLDLDLAFKLCQKYPGRLAEAKIYLENWALKDYVSPLRDLQHVFGYLALMLTSRFYPTGEDMPENQAKEAKECIYSELFLNDADLKLLRELLRANEASFYTCLNEAFEDSWLNENAEINRQTILMILIHLEEGAANGLSKGLCVFVARNYPKYRQYIVLPEAVLVKIVDELSRTNREGLDAEEAQLALLSLLSVYKPRDMNSFVQTMVHARYMLVLHQLYRKRNELLSLVALKLDLGDRSQFWSIVADSLARDRPRAVIFITQHLQRLCEFGLRELCKLVVSTNIQEAWQASLVNSLDESTRLPYLDELFGEIERQGGTLPPLETRTMYIELLAAAGCSPALVADGAGASADATTHCSDPSSSDSSDRLMYVLTRILRQPQDLELPLVVDSLIANDRIDALTVLLCRREREAEAMIYLLNFLPELILRKTGSSQLTRYVMLACDVCISLAKRDHDEGCELCQRLVETLIQHGAISELNHLATIMMDAGVVEISSIARSLLVNAKLWTKTEDENIQDSQSPGRVLGGIYAELVRKERSLRCLREIVMKDSYKELLEVLAGRAQGWIAPVDGECELCGHKIIGLGIEAEKLYADWWTQLGKEERELCSAALVLFQCGHSYHESCLLRTTDRRSCVACVLE